MTQSAGHSDYHASWDTNAVMQDLENRYPNGSIDTWQDEEQRLRLRIEALRDQLCQRYSDPVGLGVGGSGVVLRLTDKRLADRRVALKFPRPSPGKLELLASLMSKEIGHLVHLRHRSIVQILETDHVVSLSDSDEDFPYYIMEFVDGGDSSAYFRDNDTDEDSFLTIVRTTLEAVQHMHLQDIAHLDIKPANVLVERSSMLPIISDLGTAKVLSGDSGLTLVSFTLGFADRELARYADDNISDENRARGSAQRKDLKREWDLAPLGRTLLDWLGFDLHGNIVSRKLVLSQYARKYLMLMAARMLRGDVPSWLSLKVGIDSAVLYRLSYRNVDEALLDSMKVSKYYSLHEFIPELNAYAPRTIQVVKGSPTTFTERLRALVDHPMVQRLAKLSQLGLVSQVYPTSSHSRFEHSLGTYHFACRFVLSLYHDQTSPLFRQIVTERDIRALLVAAVLHDVGQYPLAHDLEEIDDRLFAHTSLGLSIISGIRDSKRKGSRRIVLPSFDDVFALWDVKKEEVLRILAASPEDESYSVQERLMHSILDGPLDADKFDYLSRDSDELKLTYGNALDYERILRSLTVMLQTKPSGTIVAIGVHEKAKTAAEFVSVVRYVMFSQAYWQHTVRAQKAMMTRGVLSILKALARSGERERNRFRSEFEALVLTLPRSLSPQRARQKTYLEAIRESEDTETDAVRFENQDAESKIAETDVIVLSFLQDWLLKNNLPEAELLEDIVLRQIYDRVAVFPIYRDRENREVQQLAQRWERLTPSEKLSTYSKVEAQLVQLAGHRSNTEPLTVSIDHSLSTKIQLRVAGGKPLILVDAPNDRPGAEVGLHFVMEAQRRMLRRDERAVGRVHRSEVWEDFADDLQWRAGSLRIFCHPLYSDAIEAAVPPDSLFRILKSCVDDS